MTVSKQHLVTLRIDTTPGQIAVVMERPGQKVSYPCASLQQAEVLLRQEQRRFGLLA